jgi:secreted trypsin-like serine protease
VVLTAAHCTTYTTPYFVKVGAESLNDQTAFTQVSAVWTSPRYNPKTFINDVGLLKLTERFEDIKVPTLTGDDVTVRLAPGTSNGRVLRVKGRGVTKAGATGDLLVTVEVQVPKRLDQKSEEALKNFASATEGEDVRAEFNSKANS